MMGEPVGLFQPRRIARYDVLVPIASGGMAVVYLAHQRGAGGFGRDVAVKLVHLHLRDNPEWSAALFAEAKLAARIRHPNVVQTLDVGEDPEGDYLVMEYVEGATFASMVGHAMGLPEKTLPLGIAVRVLADALAGLHAAHELTDDHGAPLGVVHRDFSPQNVLVGLDGITRLSDFGVAKAADRAVFTATGTIKGKFAFMSPEQVRARPLDRRSDVWSAGVVAWEMLAGRRMFERGIDEASILLRIASESPPPLEAVNPRVPPELLAAVTHALQRDLDERTQSALALREELVGALGVLGISLATQEEVGAYVRLVAGATLDKRRVAAKAARKGAEEASVSGTSRGLVLGARRRDDGIDPADGKTQTAAVADSRRSPRTRRLGALVVGFAAFAGLAGLWTRPRAPRSMTEEPRGASTPSSEGANRELGLPEALASALPRAPAAAPSSALVPEASGATKRPAPTSPSATVAKLGSPLPQKAKSAPAARPSQSAAPALPPPEQPKSSAPSILDVPL